MASNTRLDPTTTGQKRKARDSFEAAPQKRGPRFVKINANKRGLSDLSKKARRLIYAHCLTQDEPIRCVAALSETTQELNFNVLLASKLIAREAKEVLYGGNTFRVDVVNVPGAPHGLHTATENIEKFICAPLKQFMARIGVKYLGKIRNLVLAFHDVQASGNMQFADLELPDKADYAAEVKLVAKKPFCEVSEVYPDEADERSKHVLADFKQGILTHGMLSDWRAAPLSRVDALEMCREYFFACVANLDKWNESDEEVESGDEMV